MNVGDDQDHQIALRKIQDKVETTSIGINKCDYLYISRRKINQQMLLLQSSGGSNYLIKRERFLFLNEADYMVQQHNSIKSNSNVED